eukprot:TRINITY_DN6404_c0_g1_i1.p1 TRINITY_DN6404_c0_g1~~TRINITY_DN6404_c0_g1_i1.p1  ORF type:complete len:370 (-),score=111.75 TRINITY_DN6404_c0_g1_i1:1116-2195(-)
MPPHHFNLPEMPHEHEGAPAAPLHGKRRDPHPLRAGAVAAGLAAAAWWWGARGGSCWWLPLSVGLGVFALLDVLLRVAARKSIFCAAHLVVYSLCTPTYLKLLKLGARVLPSFFNRYMATCYHGKVIPVDLAKRLVSLDRDICVDVGERVVPYPVARDFILRGPVTVGLIDCPCRMSKGEKRCNPVRVCMVFGDHRVGTIEKVKGKSYITRITKEQAVQLLDDEHKRGHVHTAYFKDIMDGFFALCNCCKCCCAGLELMLRCGSPCIVPSGFSANVAAPDRCVGCRACVRACPFGALEIAEGTKVVSVLKDRCMGCGVCLGQCKRGVLELVRDTSKGDPLDVEELCRVQHALPQQCGTK